MAYISFPLPLEMQSRVRGEGAGMGMLTGEKAPWTCQPHQH